MLSHVGATSTPSSTVWSTPIHVCRRRADARAARRCGRPRRASHAGRSAGRYSMQARQSDAEGLERRGALSGGGGRGRTRAVAAFVQRGHASSTALEAASLKGHDDVVQQLLRAGALPTPTALRDGASHCFAMLCDHAEEAALFDAMAHHECRAKVALRIAAHLDEGIERRMFDGEDLRKVEREKEEESKRLETVEDRRRLLERRDGLEAVFAARRRRVTKEGRP